MTPELWDDPPSTSAWEAIAGDAMTPAEEAACATVAVLADSTSGWGIHKWEWLASRLRVAAARAASGPGIWDELAPKVRGLGDGLHLTADRRRALLAALADDGVQPVLTSHLDLTIMRVRVLRETDRKPRPKPTNTTEEMF